MTEELYRQLFLEDLTGRVMATPDWCVVECNPALAQMLACERPSSLVGRSLSEFAADPLVLDKLLTLTRAHGQAGPVELQLERADGETLYVSCLLFGSVDSTGQLISLRGQFVEAAESKALQTRLLGAQRMQAVGRLAGGLAHDFNNLLTVISGHSERLSDLLARDDSLRGSVAAIQQASARAAELTRQLLAFSRRQVFELRPVAVHALVADARPLLTKILGERIGLHLDLPSAVRDVRADPRQIEHILVNLAVNAREAMTDGGTLRIRVDEVEIGERAPRERPWLRPGGFVRLLVADYGPGMDASTKAHAFQPFFTTKRMGDGSGLGLATVYGIMKQSHGFVWVDSELGRGAAFTMLFPVLHAGGADAPSKRRDEGTETILVVERDERLRTFASDALRRRGYHTLDAGSPQEALRLFAAHPARIHLLLSDSVTGEDGVLLHGRLQAIDPTVQALFMLGPSEGPRAERSAPHGSPVIQKPFTLHALADRVREVLDSGEGR